LSDLQQKLLSASTFEEKLANFDEL